LAGDHRSVMPVIAIISGGIGADGSLKAANVSLTPTILPSAKYSNLTMPSSMISSLR
jgi:hypothetical protein